MFDTICLIGNGSLAKDCCKLMSLKHSDIRFYDANEVSSWYLKKRCDDLENVKYLCLQRNELFDDILGIAGDVLIISAVNPYIIPKEIVDQERFYSINLHHSYLPLHPGRNAEAWTIFEEDSYAGVTWHVVSNKVDGGEIIANARIDLTDDITSWRLLKIQNDQAYLEFEKFVDDLLLRKISYKKQNLQDYDIYKCKLHYSYEIPNNGYLDLECSSHKMSAFLRAMDYGPAKIMGNPKINWEDDVMSIEKYNVCSIDGSENSISFSDAGGCGNIQILRD